VTEEERTVYCEVGSFELSRELSKGVGIGPEGKSGQRRLLPFLGKVLLKSVATHRIREKDLEDLFRDEILEGLVEIRLNVLDRIWISERVERSAMKLSSRRRKNDRAYMEKGRLTTCLLSLLEVLHRREVLDVRCVTLFAPAAALVI
jgi:hypothetical protein